MTVSVPERILRRSAKGQTPGPNRRPFSLGRLGAPALTAWRLIIAGHRLVLALTTSIRQASVCDDLVQKKRVICASFMVTFVYGSRSRVARCLPLLRSGLYHGCRHVVRRIFHDRGLRNLLPSYRCERALPLRRNRVGRIRSCVKNLLAQEPRYPIFPALAVASAR